MPLDEAIRQRIQGLVNDHRVLLFMKGDRAAPQCGFSASVVGLLDQLVADYHTENVLADPALREGIKAFSEWPTIPQLYVGGEFVGGCDIVTEMFDNGELHTMLGVASGSDAPPRIRVTKAAAEVLTEGLARAGADGVLRLLVDARHQARIVISPPGERDFRVESEGVVLAVDPLSALRAEDAEIDVEQTRRGPRLRVLLPHASAPDAQGESHPST